MNNTEQIEKKQKLLKTAPYIICGASVSFFSTVLFIVFFLLYNKLWILFAIGFVLGQVLIAMGYIKYYKK